MPQDLEAIYQIVTPQAVSDERPRHVFRADQIELPTSNQMFAFSGQVKPEQHGRCAVAFQHCVYPGLRYTHTEDEIHFFQLPVEHPGHDSFSGCSGAPIVNMNRNVVALVRGGDTSTNTVHGVSLARYKPLVDLDTQEPNA